ncbi:MAG: DUF1127 domain-containing protein [Rhodobacteraceae bacterium]|nr:DUF1127 domain-containing protein [Paracoccaceae bacterium]
MAMSSQITSQRGAVAFNPLAWTEALTARFARYRLYRRTLNELTSLNNRELADLGLNRSMLTRIAYQAAYENQ